MIVELHQFNLRVPPSQGRSDGLHLSTVLRHMALQRGVLDSKYEDQGDLNQNTVLQLGLAWEDYLALYQHPEIVYHPGELNLDGIAMSPDGISENDGEMTARVMVEKGTWLLHEFKATQKSSRGFEEKLRAKDKKCLLWLWQIMGYRHAINILHPDNASLAARLHVLFLNGNYSRDFSDRENGPNYKIYNLFFDQDELETNWMVIKSYADGMREE